MTEQKPLQDGSRQDEHQVRIKIAVIGVGSIGPRHAHTILKEPGITLCAIVDLAPLSKELAISLSVPFYSSVAELIKSPNKPDGAIICTPNHTHVPVALELLAASVAVVVEKPISIDIRSGQQLVDASRATKIPLIVGHHRRFNPYISAAKRLLDRETIGSIVAVNGLWTTFKPIEYFSLAPWRQTKQGGILLINMIHEIDTLQFLLGRISRVYAEKTVSYRGFDAEEGAAITLRFESGCVGTFLISDHVPSPHFFEAGTGENPLIPKAGRDFLKILGTEGTLSLPEMTISHYGQNGENSWQSHVCEDSLIEEVDIDEVPFTLQLRNFVEVIEGKGKPRCTGEDGLAALTVCEAIKRSLEIQMPVEVAQLSIDDSTIA